MTPIGVYRVSWHVYVRRQLASTACYFWSLKTRKPPRRGQPLCKWQMARPQSVLCSKVLLYTFHSVCWSYVTNSYLNPGLDLRHQSELLRYIWNHQDRAVDWVSRIQEHTYCAVSSPSSLREYNSAIINLMVTCFVFDTSPSVLFFYFYKHILNFRLFLHLMPRSDPLPRTNNLVNQIKFLVLVCTFDNRPQKSSWFNRLFLAGRCMWAGHETSSSCTTG